MRRYMNLDSIFDDLPLHNVRTFLAEYAFSLDGIDGTTIVIRLYQLGDKVTWNQSHHIKTPEQLGAYLPHQLAVRGRRQIRPLVCNLGFHPVLQGGAPAIGRVADLEREVREVGSGATSLDHRRNSGDAAAACARARELHDCLVPAA